MAVRRSGDLGVSLSSGEPFTTTQVFCIASRAGVADK